MFTQLTDFPTIETERLLLRVPNENDFAALAEMYADPNVMEFLGGPIERDVTWRTLATFIGHWCLLGYGLFSVIEKSSGKFVGRVGLINPDGWPALEIGWAIVSDYWGKGMATESSVAVIEHERARLRPKKLISLVDHRNDRSARVAGKLQGHNCGQTKFLGSPTDIYAYPV